MLKIADTVPPAGEPVEQYIFMGNEVSAGDFAANITDATEVRVSFASPPPDFDKPGWQDVRVILTDEGNNSTELSSRLYIFDIVTELTIEARMVDNIVEKSFIINFLLDIGGRVLNPPNVSFDLDGDFDFEKVGSYDLTLRTGRFYKPVVLNIVDTTPPIATARNLRILKGQTVRAIDFVYDIRDFSPVTVRYKYIPDFELEGTQTVYIILRDLYNNIAEYSAELTIVASTAPPVISGVTDRTVTVGGTVAYRDGVTVSDNYDPDVQLVIDASRVNLNQAGIYTVVYSATNASGNRAEVRANVTVKEIDLDLVNGMADEILARIINNNMSQTEKARAIYDWVHARMTYSTRNPTKNLAQAAYNCFARGAGDCYVYMAASRVLLTRAGILNEIVKRYGGETEHYWNLVNAGSGWHHFDVCPTPSDIIKIGQRFMFTESQAEQFTRELASRRSNYYVYDKSAAPETVR